MNVDRYTKAVLTVIAGALLYICLMVSGLPVSAQGLVAPKLLQQVKPQPVVIVGWGSVRADGQIFAPVARESIAVHVVHGRGHDVALRAHRGQHVRGRLGILEHQRRGAVLPDHLGEGR